MWRTAKHKLILRMKRRADDDASQYTAADVVGGEFYDLSSDPQEWHDLYSSATPRIKEMKGELLDHLKKQSSVL